MLEAESTVKAEEREKFLAEKCPPLELPYSKDELMVRRKQDRLTVTLDPDADTTRHERQSEMQISSLII